MQTNDTIAYMEATAVLVGIQWAETVEDKLAIAGYAIQHAPESESNRMALLTTRMRTFDRKGGKIQRVASEFLGV